MPSPFLCMTIFDKRVFLKHHSVLQWNILKLSDKNFRRKNLKPPIMNKIFRCPKFSKTFKGCPRIFSALWDQKVSVEKRDTPLFIHKEIFETRKFFKNSKIPLRNFSALWHIKFSTENREMPTLIHKFISIPEFFWKTDGFLYKEFPFGPVKQKTLAKSWCPPPMHGKIR